MFQMFFFADFYVHLSSVTHNNNNVTTFMISDSYREVVGQNVSSDKGHLCFTITKKGHMIVPDWYNIILSYTKTKGKNKILE